MSTIVTGFAIDAYRNSLKLNVVSNDDSNSLDDVGYFENFDKVELLSVFEKSLDQESKIFFYLKYIYGYKSSEIAEIYKVNAPYVRKKLQLAREKLKQNLDERK